MRRVLAVRRAILPLAAPYLGVACLALFALASSGARSTELGLFARTSPVGAASASSLNTYLETHQHLTPDFVPTCAGSVHGSQMALVLSQPVAQTQNLSARLEHLATPTAHGGSAGALLIAVALARAH